MAKVAFLKGTLEQLNTTKNVEGLILFTTDEKALYLDLGGENRIRISDIIMVANEAGLPEEDQIETAIYYQKDTKALKVYSEGNWHQINENTDTGATSIEIAGNGMDKTVLDASYDPDGRKITITVGKKLVTEDALTEAISQAKEDLVGTGDIDDDTIKGAKKHADDKIAAAVSSTYKPAGSISAEDLTVDKLNKTNEGKVYNVSDKLTINSDNVSNFVDGTAQGEYPAGTNVVVINTASTEEASYKFDILAGFVDLTTYATKTEMNGAIETAKNALIGSVEGVSAETIQQGVKEAKDYADLKLTAALEWGSFTPGE